MKELTCRDVTLIQEKSGYKGFFSIKQYSLQHSLFQGGQSRKLVRECFERGHAVGVLAYDPWCDAIVLLQQFRIGAYINIMDNKSEASASPWLLEIIAGIVEPGESCSDVAHREAKEEAGLQLLAMEAIGDFYSSPGGSSETTRLYCACVDSEGADGGLYGLDHEGEDILVKVVFWDGAVQLLETGQLNNASAIIAMQWLMLHRDTLRAQWLDSALSKNKA